MKKESLVKFYQDNKLYIFPVIVALSSLFLIIFAIYPQTVKLIGNQQAESKLLGNLEFLEGKVAALESLSGEDLSKKVKYALSSLPAEKDPGNTIGLLQQLAVQSGFVVASISLSEGGSFKTAESYQLKMAVRGSRDFLPNLLNSIEGSSRLIRINSLDTSASAGGVDVALTLEVLYANPPQDFGSIDSPLPELSQREEELIARLAEIGVQPSAATFVSKGKLNPFE